jgi:hypothetical protein
MSDSGDKGTPRADLAQEQSLADLEQALGDREQLLGDRGQARGERAQVRLDDEREDEDRDDLSSAKLFDARQARLDRDQATQDTQQEALDSAQIGRDVHQEAIDNLRKVHGLPLSQQPKPPGVAQLQRDADERARAARGRAEASLLRARAALMRAEAALARTRAGP